MPSIKKLTQDTRSFENEGLINLNEFSAREKQTICLVLPFDFAKCALEILNCESKKKVKIQTSESYLKY